jgi:hypothetical protein
MDTEDTIAVSVPSYMASAVEASLAAAGIVPAVFREKRFTGLEVFVTIILPVTIGGLQILATFLAAPPGPPEGRAKVTIKVNNTVIAADNLNPETVERIVGKALRKA